jgi:hypothetical protein
MGQQLGPVAAKLRLGYGVVEVDAVAASIITVRVFVAVLPQVSVATQQLTRLVVVDDEKPRVEI